jgi:hypothetical protein
MKEWLVIAFTSLVYVLIAQGITKDNAKYLLSGYNTLSAAAQKRFDIVGFLVVFKRFFWLLALLGPILFGIGLLLFPVKTALLIWSAAQILPYPYLFYKSQRFKNNA